MKCFSFQRVIKNYILFQMKVRVKMVRYELIYTVVTMKISTIHVWKRKG